MNSKTHILVHTIYSQRKHTHWPSTPSYVEPKKKKYEETKYVAKAIDLMKQIPPMKLHLQIHSTIKTEKKNEK